ncbi:hypothetical protein D3C73_721270 [compost metagenome]
MSHEAIDFSFCVDIIDRLPFLPIIRNRVRGKCLLPVSHIMRAKVVIIEPAFDSKRLTKGVDNEAVLIGMAMVEATIGTGFKIERDTVGIIQLRMHSNLPHILKPS